MAQAPQEGTAAQTRKQETVAHDDATTIRGKTGERLVLTAEQLQGNDWMLEELQARPCLALRA